MNDELALSSTVADLINSTPKALRFFLDQKTACGGCPLARFCTLQDVIQTYELNVQSFRGELARIVTIQ